MDGKPLGGAVWNENEKKPSVYIPRRAYGRSYNVACVVRSDQLHCELVWVINYSMEEDNMTIEKITKYNQAFALVTGNEKSVTDVQSALDLIMSVKYNAGTNKIIIDKKIIAEEFFILSTGLAGEILQKFINYDVKAAIYGDYSKYTSKPLKDFIYESNNGKDVFFVSSIDEAVQKLSKI